MHQGRRFINIAFPLPFANMTSVLLLENAAGGALSLTSLARDDGAADGDQGVFVVTAFGALRLPLDETIVVQPEADGALSAVHDMWLFGLHYLRLTYVIDVGEPRGGVGCVVPPAQGWLPSRARTRTARRVVREDKGLPAGSR